MLLKGLKENFDAPAKSVKAQNLLRRKVFLIEVGNEDFRLVYRSHIPSGLPGNFEHRPVLRGQERSGNEGGRSLLRCWALDVRWWTLN